MDRVSEMNEQKESNQKFYADRYFWMGVFASPILICLFYFLGDPFGNGDETFFWALGLIILIATLVGAFYCGFRLSSHCFTGPGVKVVFGLLFACGFLVIDFAVFFVGCCAALSMA